MRSLLEAPNQTKSLLRGTHAAMPRHWLVDVIRLMPLILYAAPPTVLPVLFFSLFYTITLVRNHPPPITPFPSPSPSLHLLLWTAGSQCAILFIPRSSPCSLCSIPPSPSFKCRAQLDQARQSSRTLALLALEQAVPKLCWWNRKTRVSSKELLCFCKARKRTVRGHSLFGFFMHAEKESGVSGQEMNSWAETLLWRDFHQQFSNVWGVFAF